MAVAGHDGIHRRVGFIGLGRMGEPMAVRLVQAGTPLTVWSRTPASVRRVADAGATPAVDAAAVFAASDVVLLMLANGEAVDAVLGRSADGFGVPVEGRLVVSTGTVAPEHSRALAAELARHGARFVEAPVSGSRVPAQHGQLVAMLAGDEVDVEEVRRLVAPLASAVFACGQVPLRARRGAGLRPLRHDRGGRGAARGRRGARCHVTTRGLADDASQRAMSRVAGSTRSLVNADQDRGGGTRWRVAASMSVRSAGRATSSEEASLRLRIDRAPEACRPPTGGRRPSGSGSSPP